MSDTPRTDAAWPRGMTDHARRLERELSAMTAERDRLRADLALASGHADALREQCKQRQDENDGLRALLADALDALTDDGGVICDGVEPLRVDSPCKVCRTVARIRVQVTK